jgi:hypothetical protein
MRRVKKETLRKKDFIPKYLKLINVILPNPLTSKELDILSSFMELEGDLVESDRFGTQARSYVREKFGFKTYSNLDNYIKFFKNKGVIFSDSEGKLRLNPKISIPKHEKEIELTFSFKLLNE